MKTVTTIAELRHALAPLASGRRSGSCRRWARSTPATSRCSPPRAPECERVVASVFVNPAQFSRPGRPRRVPARLRRRRARGRGRGVDLLFAPAAEELYPPGFATWVVPEGAAGRARGRGTPRPLPRRRDRLREALHDRPAATSRTSAARTPSRSRSSSRSSATSISSWRSASSRPSATPTGSRSRRATAGSRHEERARALAIPRALATRDPARARAVLAEAGIEPDYVAVADLDGPTLAVAARIGSTRLIDNVLLEGDSDEHPSAHARPVAARAREAARSRSSREMKRRGDRDHDGHRLRRPGRAARGRGRRRAGPRRRLGGDGDARPRVDRPGHARRDDLPHRARSPARRAGRS